MESNVMRKGRDATALQLGLIELTYRQRRKQQEEYMRVGLAIGRHRGDAEGALSSELPQALGVDCEIGAAAGDNVLGFLKLRPQHRTR